MRVSFHFTPPEGLPDGDVLLSLFTAEGAVFGDDTNPITLTPDATTEDTTVEVAVGGDTLTVASSTGFVVGKRYLVILDDGYWFEIKLKAKTSTTLTLDEGVPVIVPIGATVRGWGVTHSLTSTELGTVRRDIKALYTYDIGGESVQYIERFDCVREPFKVAITLKHIREKAADFSDFSGASNRWRSYVDGAHTEVDEILRAQGIFPDRIANREALRSAVVNCILMKLHALTQNPLTEVYRVAMTDCIARAVAQRNTYDANDSGNKDDGDSDVVPAARYLRFV